MGLLACPFCREMFEEGEARACPVCGMKLAKFEALPLSHDAVSEEGALTAPELEPLSWKELGRGRGLLAVVGLVGMALFFLPWVNLTLPYPDTKSGFDLAHQRIGWLWASFVAWSVLVPTVLSRRTIAQLRGARVAAAFLSAIPAVAIAVLLARPPRGGLIPVRYTWEWPIFAMLVVSLVGVTVAVRLGGRIDDLKAKRGSSAGEQLH